MNALKDVLTGMLDGVLSAIVFLINSILLVVVVLGGLLHILGAAVMVYPFVTLLLLTGLWVVVR